MHSFMNELYVMRTIKHVSVLECFGVYETESSFLIVTELLRGGNLPVAWAYPKTMRSQRDLCRRRCYFTRQLAELQAHVRNSCMQYNVPLPTGQLRYTSNQEGLALTGHECRARLHLQTPRSRTDRGNVEREPNKDKS